MKPSGAPLESFQTLTRWQRRDANNVQIVGFLPIACLIVAWTHFHPQPQPNYSIPRGISSTSAMPLLQLPGVANFSSLCCTSFPACNRLFASSSLPSRAFSVDIVILRFRFDWSVCTVSHLSPLRHDANHAFETITAPQARPLCAKQDTGSQGASLVLDRRSALSIFSSCPN